MYVHTYIHTYMYTILNVRVRAPEIRGEEQKFISRKTLIQALTISVAPMIPTLCTVAVVGIEFALGRPLLASTTFTLVSLLNTSRVALKLLPAAIKSLSDVGGC